MSRITNTMPSPTEHQYLSEDIAQIKRYFPGAQPVTLYTPFDITPKPRRRRAIDLFQGERNSATCYTGELQWTS